jgi:hypothetical protein
MAQYFFYLIMNQGCDGEWESPLADTIIIIILMPILKVLLRRYDTSLSGVYINSIIIDCLDYCSKETNY